MLGANTRVIDPAGSREDRDQRILYNEICKDLTRAHEGLEYVGIDNLVPVSQMADEWHYSRMGYLMVAEEVKRRMALGRIPHSTAVSVTGRSVWNVVRQGRPVSAFSLLGPQGYGEHRTKQVVKHMLKSTPVGRLALTAAKMTLRKRPQPAAAQP